MRECPVLSRGRAGAARGRAPARRGAVGRAERARGGGPPDAARGARPGEELRRRAGPDRLLAGALREYRCRVWRAGPGAGVRSLRGAAAFVKQVGLCLLFGCEEIPLPKLELCGPPDFEWWEWKDRLQERRQAYLGRVIRRKATLVSLDLLPAFLGLYYASGGVEVYDEEHHHGRLSEDAWRIGEHLSCHGPTPVDRLRRSLMPPGPAGTRRFHRALDEMQEKFKTVTVGRVQKHWSVRVVGLLSEWAQPQALREAHALARRPGAARGRILERAVRAAGALGVREAASLFGWPRTETERAATLVARSGAARRVTLAPAARGAAGGDPDAQRGAPRLAAAPAGPALVVRGLC